VLAVGGDELVVGGCDEGLYWKLSVNYRETKSAGGGGGFLGELVSEGRGEKKSSSSSIQPNVTL